MESSGILTSSGSFDRFQSVRNFSSAFTESVHSSRFPIPCVTLHPERLVKLLGANSSLDFISIKLNLLLDQWSYNKFNIGLENRKAYVYFTNPKTYLKTGLLKFLYAGSTSTYLVEQSHIMRITDCNDLNYFVEEYDSSMTKTWNVSGDFDACREFASQVLFFKKCGCQNPFLPIFKLTDGPAKLCFNVTMYNDAEIKANLKCLNDARSKYSQGGRFTKVMEKV